MTDPTQPPPAPHESLPEQPEIESTISSIISTNRRSATAFTVTKHSNEASKNWDKFYKNHQDKFFKDRHWTSREFSSQLASSSSSSATGAAAVSAIPSDSTATVASNAKAATAPASGSQASLSTGKPKTEDDREEETSLVSQEVGGGGVLLEVGCGVGNMLYPLLECNASLRVHCCDFSSRAVDLVRSHPSYDPARVNAFVFDLTSSSPSLSSYLSTPPYSSWPAVTTISLIFVLSAIPPDLHSSVLRSLAGLLPNGGHILFRDYAYGDLSQVRYHTKKDAAWAEPSLLSQDPEHNWYRRGDNTFNYFFKKEQLEELAKQAGLVGEIEVLRRTAVNRRSEVNMQRRFVQAKWFVPPRTQS